MCVYICIEGERIDKQWFISKNCILVFAKCIKSCHTRYEIISPVLTYYTSSS